MADETKAKRRLADVEADEISLVDNPAIGETFKIIKRQPTESVQKDNAPTHEALLNEKIAGFKTAADAFMSSVGDVQKMQDWAHKVRGMLWGICDAMDAMPVISSEVGKQFTGMVCREGVCKMLDSFASVNKDNGGTAMEKCPTCGSEMKEGKCEGCAQKTADEAKKAEAVVEEAKKTEALAAAVTKAVLEAIKAQSVTKAANPPPDAIADLRKENEALKKRLDDLEKTGVTRTAPDNGQPVKKAEGFWKGTVFDSLEGSAQ